MTTLPAMGLTMRFRVRIDSLHDLGHWSSCRGLAVDFSHLVVKEGAEYGAARYLPERITYHSVELARAMVSESTTQVRNWLSTVARTWYDDALGGAKPASQTAAITLFDATGKPVTTWTLRNVYPRSWRAPDLDASSSSVAVERLELVHEGFL
jgi:phage tail-like protein